MNADQWKVKIAEYGDNHAGFMVDPDAMGAYWVALSYLPGLPTPLSVVGSINDAVENLRQAWLKADTKAGDMDVELFAMLQLRDTPTVRFAEFCMALER